MAWIKLNDAFPNHPKIVGLSDLAFRIHVTGLCYCGTYLTDGYLPYTVVNTMITTPELKPTDELEKVGLWYRVVNGFQIHDYLAHQTSKQQVQEKQEALRERQKRYRERKSNNANNNNTLDDWEQADNAVTNTNVTRPEYRIQNTEYIKQNTQLKDNYFPRVKVAQLAVTRISDKLADARANGINAWNLSKLVEDEWDVLHNANEIGGCIALTAWYVSELQSRPLTTSEISRIGQMTKRFGRIALLAIDEAASKDLTDLVSYAFRVAQNLYKERAVQ